jgi:hypothetical protein
MPLTGETDVLEGKTYPSVTLPNTHGNKTYVTYGKGKGNLPWRHRRSIRSTAQLILKLGAWRWMVKAIWLLYPVKESRHTLRTRLSGLQSRSGRFGEEKISSPTPELETRKMLYNYQVISWPSEEILSSEEERYFVQLRKRRNSRHEHDGTSSSKVQWPMSNSESKLWGAASSKLSRLHFYE